MRVSTMYVVMVGTQFLARKKSKVVTSFLWEAKGFCHWASAADVALTIQGATVEKVRVM